MTERDILVRLGMAILIGGFIGYEREFKNRPAGFRTHILVCIGATIVSLTQVAMADYTINVVTLNPDLAEVLKVDYARLGAQVITGVGFLGAGTILHTKGSIKGLTTAASLWVVACLGLSIGLGYYTISIFGAICISLTLGVLKKFQTKFITKSGTTKLEIQYVRKNEAMKYIEEYFEAKNIIIKELEYCGYDEIELQDEVINEWSDRYTISIPKTINVNQVVGKLSLNENILRVKCM